MPKFWQIPQAAPASPPPRPTKLFSDIVFCPFYSECHTCWETPVKHCTAEDDVEYSEYRLHLNVLTRLRAHFRKYHNHIRAKTQINITINGAGNSFALSKGKIGQCPTCLEQLFRPTEEEKIDPFVCLAMAKSVSDHRWANRPCQDRFLGLYTDKDLGDVVPKTFIWGYRPWIPATDKPQSPIDRQVEQGENSDVSDSESEAADTANSENSPQVSPKYDEDEIMEDTPLQVDLIAPRNTRSARGRKPTSVSPPPSETFRETTPPPICEPSPQTKNTDEESTASSSQMDDVIMSSPPAESPTSTSSTSRQQTRSLRVTAKRPIPTFALSCQKFLRKPVYAMSCLDVTHPNGMWSEPTKCLPFPQAKAHKRNTPLPPKKGDHTPHKTSAVTPAKSVEINVLDMSYSEWRERRSTESPHYKQISVASLLNPESETEDCNMSYGEWCEGHFTLC